MRLALVVLSIVLSASACFAQGEILDRGQSAIFAYYGLATGSGEQYNDSYQVNLKALGLGYSHRGLFDYGLSIAMYSRPSDAWSPSLSVNEHVVRAGDPSRSVWVISLHQSIAWIGREFRALPGDDTQEQATAGAQATLKLTPSSAAVVSLSAAYLHSFGLSEGGRSADALQIDGAYVVCTKGTRYLITPLVQFQNDQTTYGVTLSLMFLTHAETTNSW